jgi:dienelactone hydrolase
MPGIVLTYGHGGSKSTWEHQYAGQLYAGLGLACLAMDPIGEDERNLNGGRGTRAHDNAAADAQAARAGRLIMGKLVFDTMRGIDFLQQRNDVDPDKIGIAGYSLGGATAAWVAALDQRVRLALICGWAYDDITLRTKLCTRVPNVLMREQMSWTDYAALAAPHCSLRVMNGDADVVIDTDDDKSAWDGTKKSMAAMDSLYRKLGGTGDAQVWFEPAGGHRPFFLYKPALQSIRERLGTPAMTAAQLDAMPTIHAGRWLDLHGIQLERLYGTELHWRGGTLAGEGINYLAPENLSVLRADERGKRDFTLEGWLQQISLAQKRDQEPSK